MWTKRRRITKYRRIFRETHASWLIGSVAFLLFFGIYGIYWSQATRVTPVVAPYPIAPPSEAEIQAVKSRSAPSPVEIRVYGTQSSQGHCILYIYGSAQDFDKPELAIMREKAEIFNGFAYWSPKNLAKGAYAITAFEDSNMNGRLDRDRFGNPNEAYGFSNNPVVAIGVPQFHDVAFAYDGQSQVDIDIYLRPTW